MAVTTKKAWNIKFTILSVEESTTITGTRKLNILGTYNAKRKGSDERFKLTRSCVAMGVSADEVADAVVPGAEVELRVLFENAPLLKDGEKIEGKGGEYCVVLGLAWTKEQREAHKAAKLALAA